MGMISDDERREVAARLREAREFISITPNTIPEQSGYEAFKLILACVGYERGNVFDILAGLVDRPACRDFATNPADSIERVADELEAAEGWCDQNGRYDTGTVSITEAQLREWSDRIRKLAKEDER
jgi:hypothetical protein